MNHISGKSMDADKNIATKSKKFKGLRINSDGSEILDYDEAGIPIYIREGYLSHYPEYRALCHWHEDLEFIYVLEGGMDYYINGENITLTKGNILLVNAGRLHYGYSMDRQECRFYCIIFHPIILAPTKSMMKKWIDPITQNTELDYLLLDKHEKMEELLTEIFRLKKNFKKTYELEVMSCFHKLWNYVYGATDIMPGEVFDNEKQKDAEAELVAQRKMTAYIYQNFSENLTLEEIAESGGVCRSKCCQLFKKYVGQSPMEFVNAYRLECSQNLLQATDMNITDICMGCGFNHLSYFSKQFRIKYGCTPREYRYRY